MCHFSSLLIRDDYDVENVDGVAILELCRLRAYGYADQAGSVKIKRSSDMRLIWFKIEDD